MSRIYVGNLEPRTTERELEDEFRPFGVLRRKECVACGTFLQFWRWGPRRGGGRGQGSSDLKCYECGEPGHFARECHSGTAFRGSGQDISAAPVPNTNAAPVPVTDVAPIMDAAEITAHLIGVFLHVMLAHLLGRDRTIARHQHNVTALFLLMLMEVQLVGITAAVRAEVCYHTSSVMHLVDHWFLQISCMEDDFVTLLRVLHLFFSSFVSFAVYLLLISSWFLSDGSTSV